MPTLRSLSAALLALSAATAATAQSGYPADAAVKFFDIAKGDAPVVARSPITGQALVELAPGTRVYGFESKVSGPEGLTDVVVFPVAGVLAMVPKKALAESSPAPKERNSDSGDTVAMWGESLTKRVEREKATGLKGGGNAGLEPTRLRVLRETKNGSPKPGQAGQQGPIGGGGNLPYGAQRAQTGEFKSGYL